MQPRFIIRRGEYVQTFRFLPGPGGFTTTVPNTVKEVDILRDVISSHGDFRTPTAQSYNTWRENLWVGSTYYTHGGGSYAIDEEGDRGVGSVPLVQPDISDYLYNNCLSDMYDQVRGQIDLAVEMAQAGQTIGMVRGATKVVDFARDLFNSVRRGRPQGLIARFLRGSGGRFDRTKTVSQLWLEYQYGWRPLVQTVFDCVDALMKPARGDSWPLLVLKSRANVRESIDVFRDSNLQANVDVPYFRESVKGFMQSRGELMTQWRIPESRLLDLSRWSSLSPFGIAWELLPFSFVVDWFVNVGGYVRDLESAFLFNSAFVRGYFTHTRMYQTSYRISDEVVGLAGSRAIGVYEGFHRISSKNRTVLVSAFPRAPVFAPKLGWQRLLSAASLLAGFLGRKS